MGDAGVNIGKLLEGRVASRIPRPEGCDSIALVLQGGEELDSDGAARARHRGP